MISIPAAQSIVTGVFKKKLQRRRFDVAIAKHDIGFTLMTHKRVSVISNPAKSSRSNEMLALKVSPIAIISLGTITSDS